MILKGLRKLLASGAEGQAGAAPGREARHLAKAVLLLELARADTEVHENEEQRLRQLLVEEVGVPEGELGALLEQARDHVRHAVSLHDYVNTLNRELNPEEKLGLVEMLWRLAFEDGRIDPHEEALVRRLSDLLHVPHAEFIRAKLRAEVAADSSRAD